MLPGAMAKNLPDGPPETYGRVPFQADGGQGYRERENGLISKRKPMNLNAPAGSLDWTPVSRQLNPTL